MTTAVELLAWDTAWWGCRTGTTTVDTLDEVTADAVDDACAELGIDLLYHRQPADDLEALRIAQRHGLRMVDVRLTLAAPTGSGRRPAPGVRGDVPIRPARASDAAALGELAARSHSNSRFFADGRLPIERCRELYRHWITADLDGRADAVLVADGEGGPVGYVSLTDDGRCAHLGLIAVAEVARGAGFGHVLTAAALDWAAERDRAVMEVVTQGGSIPAQRLYQRHGFVTADVELWFHRWSQRCTGAPA